MARRNQRLRAEDIAEMLEEEDDDDGLEDPQISSDDEDEPAQVITEMLFVDNQFVDMVVVQPSREASPNPR